MKHLVLILFILAVGALNLQAVATLKPKGSAAAVAQVVRATSGEDVAPVYTSPTFTCYRGTLAATSHTAQPISPTPGTYGVPAGYTGPFRLRAWSSGSATANFTSCSFTASLGRPFASQAVFESPWMPMGATQAATSKVNAQGLTSPTSVEIEVDIVP